MIFLKKMPASSRRKRLNLEGLIGAMVVWRYESSSSDDEEEELHHPPVVFSQIFYNGVSCFPKKKTKEHLDLTVEQFDYIHCGGKFRGMAGTLS